MNALALSGSLRASSTNVALLEAARLQAPPGMTVRTYGDLGELAHFNPDLDVELRPKPVIGLCVQAGIESEPHTANR